MPLVNTVDLIGDETLMNMLIDRSITEIVDDRVTEIGQYAFRGCTELAKADFSSITNIVNWSLGDCSSLATLVIRTPSLCKAQGSAVISGTPISRKVGYIYVPRALVDSYKAATNWSTYANQFRALEDYTVDGTTTGELDPTKI